MLEITYGLRNGFSIYYIKYNFNAEVFIPVVTGISMVSGMLGGLCTPVITKRIGKRATALAGIGVTNGIPEAFISALISIPVILGVRKILR